ncbi:MAG: hypothetical protein FGM27_02800 [Candidatus Omnitrophica bacterium]|nr:hypothetical protein [Candidatus Omnitrophota bacterium]
MSLWIMALGLTVPMILLSGPVAGYLLGNLWVKHFDGGDSVLPLAVSAGFALSAYQCFRLIRRVYVLNQGAKPPEKKTAPDHGKT